MAGSLVGPASRSATASTSSSSRTSSAASRDRLKAGPPPQTTSFLRDVGVDAKYGVTGGLNLDLTYNTDFAQVEVDEQQVNLTRFSLFFPEKRDFFLENAGQFKMGTGGTFTSTTVETDLFFSRRIGLSDAGPPIPIVGGGRLAGKAGPPQHRRARHPDRQRVRQAGRQLPRRALQQRRAEALARRRHLHQQGDDGRRRALQPDDGRRREPRARQEPAGQLVRREDRHAGPDRPATWRSSAASRIAIRRGTCG